MVARGHLARASRWFPVFLYTELEGCCARGQPAAVGGGVPRAGSSCPGSAAMTLLMLTYGGFLFTFAIHLQAGLATARCAPG